MKENRMGNGLLVSANSIISDVEDYEEDILYFIKEKYRHCGRDYIKIEIANLNDLINSCFIHIEDFINIKIIATYISDDYKDIITIDEIDEMIDSLYRCIITIEDWITELQY